MSKFTMPRRRFFLGASAWGAAAAQAAPGGPGRRLHLATNQYPWTVFYRRENRKYEDSLDTVFKEVAASGLDGFEPMLASPEQVDAIAAQLKKHGLEMRSFYINATLHAEEEIPKSIAQVAAIAERARRAGTRIAVVNPSPLRWGGPENKDDAQLRRQAAALNQLGTKLAGLGVKLAYHFHDIELRHAAREFHHMMLGTDPKLVTLCLDTHWIYRGAGNSTVALFDVVKLYGRRVSELHLRQSSGGVWTETFSEGDIDYPAVAKQLLSLGVKPHLVLEQAVEKGSPNTMNVVEAHRKGAEYARKILAGFAA